jgi:hypothetical protein
MQQLRYLTLTKTWLAGLIVVGKPISVAGESSGLAMVSRISQIRDDDGDIINSLTLYQGGDVKEVDAEEENTPICSQLFLRDLTLKEECLKLL